MRQVGPTMSVPCFACIGLSLFLLRRAESKEAAAELEV